MSRRNELLALADRIEREEPSQDLDYAILTAAKGRPLYPLGTAIYGAPIPPRYTASLDAAASLVPKGWKTSRVMADMDGHIQVILERPNPPTIHSVVSIWAYAPDEPRARAAAALRAIAQEQTDE